MLQISSRKANTIKLTAHPSCHQLSERWVTILQAYEHSCPRRPQGRQLHSHDLQAHFLPFRKEKLPEIKGHIYLFFLSLEVSYQSSSYHFLSKVDKKPGVSLTLVGCCVLPSWLPSSVSVQYVCDVHTLPTKGGSQCGTQRAYLWQCLI